MLFCDATRGLLFKLTIRCLCFIDIDILVHFLIKHTIHAVYILKYTNYYKDKQILNNV